MVCTKLRLSQLKYIDGLFKTEALPIESTSMVCRNNYQELLNFILVNFSILYLPVKRSCRLWEYIRNLLLDTETNPDLICWVNRTEGSFKLVNSKKISYMWGMKKGNENMNYEKLSRAIRQVYSPCALF